MKNYIDDQSAKKNGQLVDPSSLRIRTNRDGEKFQYTQEAFSVIESIQHAYDLFCDNSRSLNQIRSEVQVEYLDTLTKMIQRGVYCWNDTVCYIDEIITDCEDWEMERRLAHVKMVAQDWLVLKCGIHDSQEATKDYRIYEARQVPKLMQKVWKDVDEHQIHETIERAFRNLFFSYYQDTGGWKRLMGQQEDELKPALIKAIQRIVDASVAETYRFVVEKEVDTKKMKKNLLEIGSKDLEEVA
jgi:hypothetical protein